MTIDDVTDGVTDGGTDDVTIVVANAPVSYGAFELTVGIDPRVPDGVAVLDEVAAAGYAGIDLGPVGFLGEGPELGRRLRARGLGLAGGYLEFPFADPDAMPAALAGLDALLETFDQVAGHVPGPPPRPTIADGGGPERRARPGSGAREHAHDDAAWERFAESLGAVVARCREGGYEPAFHHETGSYVEAPWEIEKLLSLSDVGLCLDTGHLLIAAGDPVAFATKWAGRINQVHIKDTDLAAFERVLRAGEPTSAIWSREVFPRLGEGALDADGLLRTLKGTGYSGWLVVEQDIFPRSADRFAHAASDQRANRAFLTARGL
ncbi:TIM barrel protein [Streptosporangiaceae bacterium NEAU-GS5]|nr:TIM barrel protein [Streptosporangiaceae bacterium NEAU-GS5]